jgi:23S rRNA-/tRNA-specific pseudouridylate synthase
MLGRNQEWARNISRQFVHHQIGKTYLALVYAKEGHFTETSGIIENRLSENGGRVELDPRRGTPTKTEWELLATSVRIDEMLFQPMFWLNSLILQPKLPISLMRLKLHTGHKHQLRFHLANCLHGLSTVVPRT